MTIILDMGGVLMNHNMPECIARFSAILGEEKMKTMLGLASNGEGTANSLMEQYERGDISTNFFIDTILKHAKAGTSREEVIAAWNAMHGGIPTERLEHIQQWKDAGHHLFLLSNNNDLHWHHILSQYDMSMFDYCFASHLMHMSKPDPRIYQAVDNQLRVWDCEQPFHFVDDIAINRINAEKIGWKTYETIYDASLISCFGIEPK
jgi:putative hydrolase of the HAD superfamily